MLAPWAANCAQRSLPLFEAHAPDDHRPRAAIDGARAFARGELPVGPARALAAAAHAAARGTTNPAAIAAARAAGHAAATAHMASHAVGAPAYAAKAAGLASPNDPNAAADTLDWAVQHAPTNIREILRRLPDRPQSTNGLAGLVYEIHHRLTRTHPADQTS